MKRWLPWILLGLGACALVARGIQAALGGVPTLQIAGEIGAGVIVLAMVPAWASLAPLDRARGALVVVALVGVGATILVPLWRVTHPAAPLFDGHLGGSHREDTTRAASRAGLYRIVLSRPTLDAPAGADYVLRIDAGGRKRTIRGTEGPRPSIIDLPLDKGARATLFFESIGGWYHVLVELTPVSWMPVRLGALVVALLAAVADAISRSGRRRGSFTLVVGSGAAYVALLPPGAGVPDALAAVATAGLAILGGALLVLLMAGGRALVVIMTRRSRRSRH